VFSGGIEGKEETLPALVYLHHIAKGYDPNSADPVPTDIMVTHYISLRVLNYFKV